MQTQRTLLVLLSTMSLFLLACSDLGDTVDPNQSALLGRWNWMKSVGGISTMVITPETAGYTQAFLFKKDGGFSYLRNDILCVDGRFSLSYEQSQMFINFADLRIYSGEYFRIPKVGANITGDTVVINDLMIDGFSHTYKRIR
jgi:hypothetical protein